MSDPPVERPPAEPAPFRVVHEGGASYVTARLAATNADQLASWWRVLESRDAPPEVDFDREFIVAVLGGWSPDTCHRVAVRAVEIDAAGVATVYVDRVIPAAETACGRAVTAPQQVVVVTGRASVVLFEDRLVTI